MLIRRDAGYTLVEIIVALVVFAAGALGLASGSAIVAREIATNALRARAANLATSRKEIVGSTCHTAQSGIETSGPITSEWTVSRADSPAVVLDGSISYPLPRGERLESYSLTIGCR